MASAIHGKVLVSMSCFSPFSPLEAALLNRSRPPPPPPPLRLWNPKPTAPNLCLRASNHGRGTRIAACLKGSESDRSVSSNKEASLEIKLPRRNLVVQFTCNACGETTQRTINRVAYERGTVFVQCAGCLAKHKLIDNLGLVVEYDLREDRDAGSGTD